ncbi:MAG: hypothetical protein FIA94_06745 [Nitrospirae bacterium]|nr:hypothetical protein [Nitrospirota bacterium]
MKLGEALVHGNLITQEQLKEALERQVIFGGRIGTNLVELGHIKEEEIMAFFGKFFRTPTVKPEVLEDIDPETIASLDKDLAEKYMMIPFRRDRNRLHAVMLNPRSFDVIEEIRFKTGFDIIPYVITELRLLYYLEKYYGIKRDLRFISVHDKIIDTGEEVAHYEWESQALKVAEQFAAVHEKENVIDILLNETAGIAARGAVFEVNDVLISGWKGRGIAVDGFEDMVSDSSLYDEVLSKRALYRGPVQQVPGNQKLIDRLQGTPRDCCMLPVNFHGKVICLLYVDNGNDKVLDASLSYISTLVAMAEVSFEFVLLRKKLYSVIPG